MGLLKLKHMGLTWLIWDINLNGLAVKALKDIKGLVGWRVVLCTHGSEIILAASGGTRWGSCPPPCFFYGVILLKIFNNALDETGKVTIRVSHRKVLLPNLTF